jgi:threonine aldolase
MAIADSAVPAITPRRAVPVASAQVLADAMAGCDRFLLLHGRRSPRELLADIADDVAIDRYGGGGVVAELEEEIAALLGKPAAVFLPSGTMAQQAVLRVHADRRARHDFVAHPACHLEWGEGHGYRHLHGLAFRPAGEIRQPLTVAHLEALDPASPPAALLLELPQRDLGGHLPEWEQLEAQVTWARRGQAAVHLDGARLWESTPYYRRSPAEIAALFDTVYVSFYKGLGALSGCCLAGPESDVAEVREWRLRSGGTLFALWPYAASALTCLRRRLPRMTDYFDHARAIARALAAEPVPGVEVLPEEPRSPMMHLVIQTTAPALSDAVLRLARQQHIWAFGGWFTTDSPRAQRIELSVGDATMALSPTEVRAALAFLASGAP